MPQLVGVVILFYAAYLFIVHILIPFIVNVVVPGIFFVLLAMLAGATCFGAFFFVRAAFRTIQTRNNQALRTPVYGDDPAEIAYLFGPVMDDLKSILSIGTEDTLNLSKRASAWADKEQGLESIVISVWAFILLVFGSIAVALATVFMAALIIPLAVLLALSFVLLFILDRAYCWARALFTACPACDKKNINLYYHCPNCRRPHKKLYPNRMGALYHRCECRERLPAHPLTGRHNLNTAFCSNEKGGCSAPISPGLINAREVNVPIIGGPSSGKTILMVAAIDWMQKHLPLNFDTSVSFDDEHQNTIFDQDKNTLESGGLLAKTEAVRKRATTLVIEPPSTFKRSLYIFDAAGETFTDDDLLEAHRHLSRARVIILVFDPFTLQELANELERVGGPDLVRATAPCVVSVDRVVSSVISTLEKHKVPQSKDCRFKIPLFVFVTKTDIIGLENKIGLPNSDWEDYSDAVSSFLSEHGGDPTVRLIHSHFEAVTYFAGAPIQLDKQKGNRFEIFMSRLAEKVLEK